MIFKTIPADFVWSDEWVEYNGHEYKYFEATTVTASEAERQCRELGALLVSINSDEEEEFIANKVLSRRTLSTYIGGSDKDSGMY